nr:MAG TPA: chitin synthase regulator [Caudoviricetes sp.]
MIPSVISILLWSIAGTVLLIILLILFRLLILTIKEFTK